MTDPLRVLLHNNNTAPMAAALKARFPDVQCTECQTHADLPQMLATARPDVVYTVRFDVGTPYPRDALFGPDGPQWIANGGVGTNHFGQWSPARVTVTNAAGVAADMMAEYIMGGFLHFTLDVRGLLADQAASRWQATRTVRPLQGQTLVIAGLGHAGRALAARAKAFGMQVMGTRATPQQMTNVDRVGAPSDLPAMLTQADFVAVAMPLTARTKGLIGPAEIAVMKPTTILADVSRGTIVDQTALAKALSSGKLGGAVLDVFETEPLPAASPLWGLENVLISPHCSAVHDGWEAASFDTFLDNLHNWTEGKPLFNVVDPERGY
jgi:phosphoglycerate dehydrogenase-like enzyme